MSSSKPLRNFQPSSSSPLAEPRLQKTSNLTLPPEEIVHDNISLAQEPDIPCDNKGMPTTLLSKLRTFPLFKDAPSSFHSKIGSKLNLVQYHPQEFIIKEGDPSLSMFWILKGTVRVTSTDGESIYAELSPGSFFGEIGILFNRPRTATVVARQRVLVGVLTADALNDVLHSYPIFERRIRDEAQERLAMQDKKNKADIPIIKVSMSLVPPSITSKLSASRLHRSLSILHLSRLVDASNDQTTTLSDNVDQTVSIQEFIKSVPIFSNLPPSLIHSLALGAEPIRLRPFEYIFRKGNSGTDIYFIDHGEVEVIDIEDNKEKILARLKPGSFFGEMSFLQFLQNVSNPTRSASIRSVSAVELVVIRTDLLESVCQRFPKIIDEMKNTANQRKSSNQDSQNSNQTHFLSFPNQKKDLSYRRRLISVSSPLVHAQLSSSSTNDQPAKASLFNQSWSFGETIPNFSNASGHSRSVSPVSSVESEIFDLKSSKRQNISSDDEFISRKRKADTSAPSSLPLQLPEATLDLFVPSLNQVTSFNTFLMQNTRRHSFQYMPHNKRIRLTEMAGRRRSSVLVSTGSIPDRILLKCFEYLTLPRLMILRVVSRRWRQLLYAAPTLFKKLDLTPWSKYIDDKTLISITDFVGSRPTYIDISNCFHVTDEGFSYMVNEIGMSGKIQVFKMRSLWEVSAMAIMDLTSPSVGGYLQEVDLSNCRKVTDSVVERLIGWVNQGSGKVLRLPGSEGIFNTDAGSKDLKVLNLGYCKNLTDNILHHISLNANGSLESLDLTRCTTISDAGLQYWTYRSFPNLKKLSLKDCAFLTDKAIISLANAAPGLEILDLTFCCALLDIAIEVLCLGCPKLRELDLSFCGSAVSDSSLMAISLRLLELERLLIRGCVRVTRAGVDALLSGYLSLKYFNISRCPNAHMYPGQIPAQKFQVNPITNTAFITSGPNQLITEMVI